jgi:hypothetical protein
MKPTLFRCLAVVALALVPLVAAAKLYLFAEHNCSISIPEEKGWKPNKEIAAQSEGILTAMQDSVGGRLVVLMAQAIPGDISLKTDGMIDTLRSQVGAQGKITREGHTKLGGIDAYEFVLLEPNGQASRVITTAADSTLYSLTVAVAGGNVDKDRELGKIVSSFRFLHKPVVSKR